MAILPASFIDHALSRPYELFGLFRLLVANKYLTGHFFTKMISAIVYEF